MGNGISQYSFTPVSSSSVTMKLKTIHKDFFVCLSHLLEGKKVMVLGHKAQCHPHSSWRESDDSRAKNFNAMCNFLFGNQTRNCIIAFRHITTVFQSRIMMGLGTFSTDIENIPGICSPTSMSESTKMHLQHHGTSFASHMPLHHCRCPINISTAQLHAQSSHDYFSAVVEHFLTSLFFHFMLATFS
jgi:hypothetical protein